MILEARSMPKYSRSDIKHIVRPDEFKILYAAASAADHRAWILLLWLTGGRPEEIIRLQKKDLNINQDKLTVSIETLKKPKTESFIYTRRNLCTHGENLIPYLQDLNRFILRIKREQLFIFSIRTGYNIISKIGFRVLGINLCPYNFRHSRMTLLAEAGSTNEELKRFKGSSSDKSIKPYIHARKVEYTVETTIKENL